MLLISTLYTIYTITHLLKEYSTALVFAHLKIARFSYDDDNTFEYNKIEIHFQHALMAPRLHGWNEDQL